ncbi:hypothetical protein Tco_0503814 [Tanacetum coccineum]
MQGVSKIDFENYVKANDAVLRNMQNQGQGLFQSNVINPRELSMRLPHEVDPDSYQLNFHTPSGCKVRERDEKPCAKSAVITALEFNIEKRGIANMALLIERVDSGEEGVVLSHGGLGFCRVKGRLSVLGKRGGYPVSCSGSLSLGGKMG